MERIEVERKPLGDVKESEFFVDASGLHYAGLASKESDKKRLFMRNANLDLLKKLKEGDFRGMRIFGPPGVGKSCLVWLWACDESCAKNKTVLWVHLSKKGPSTAVLMKGANIFKVKDADADYIKSSDADIVAVDGVIESASHEIYSLNLFTWAEFPNRKCIQVA